ncbi:MAG: glucuronate isomerase, partial [Tepidisphaeraceae bacterium]
VNRFLTHWLDRMKAIYVAVSLPPEFRYPAEGNRDSPSAIRHPPSTIPASDSGDLFLRDCLLPLLAERRMPFAMMIGSRCRTRVNPALRDAGDMVGKADVMSVVNLCREFPKNKFLVTMLARENQHELCVAARKFGNLMVFGCWWFLNNPSLIEEITRMRIELLGTSFCPQHSDARVLDQLIYKWGHSRRIIAKVLADKYADLEEAGYRVTRAHMERDARLLLRDNFREFVKR